MFKTVQPITTTPGHYYAFGVDTAAINCGIAGADPGYQFASVDPATGATTNIGSPLDPCQATNSPTVHAYTQSVTSNVGGSFGTVTKTVNVDSSMTNNAFQATGTSIGLEMYNTNGVTNGNDGAFSNIRLIDVTPQLDKSFSPTLIAPGQTSTVTLTITNTSDLAAKNDWSITDTLPTGLTIASPSSISSTCTQTTGTAPFVMTGAAGAGVFTVTGGDLQAGQSSCKISFNVTAVAEGSYTNGPGNITSNLNPPGSATLQVQSPRIILTKSLGGTPRRADTDQFVVQIRTGGAAGTVVNDTTHSTSAGAGSTVTAGTGTTGTFVATSGTTYSLTETAAGTALLSDYTQTITCTDANGHQTGLPTNAPFVGSLDITPVAGANIACSLTNTAKPTPNIDVAKSAGTVSGPAANGDYQATYAVTVTNSGGAAGTYGPLTDTPSFAPNLLPTGATWTSSGGGGPGGSSAGAGPYVLAQSGTTIAAGATHTYNLTVTFHYTNGTQASACASTGSGLFNAASLPAGQEQGTAANNSACIPPPAPPAAAIQLTKTAGAVTDANGTAAADAGDTIAYSFVVKNTGNVTLNPVSVSDPLLASEGISVTCPAGALAPAASVTCVASGPYVLTQADVNAGVVNNSATATGTPPPDITPPQGPAQTTTPVPSGPAITLTKTPDKSTLVAGQTITYSFVATNTGNVTLSNATISEATFSGTGTLSPLTCAPTSQPATLAPGAQLTCTATYVVTQADVDANKALTNTATVSANPPTGPPVGANANASVPDAPTAALALVKRVSSVVDINQDGLTDAGDEIDYSFSVTNVGDVTIQNVAISDPMLPIVICAATTLAPGATTTCVPHSPHVVTQGDVNAGSVHNTAVATGTDPNGGSVPSNPSSTITPTDQRAGLTLEKKVHSVSDVNGNGLVDQGDQIVYDFVLTNTGTLSLSNVGVDDPLLASVGIAVTCPSTTLDAGQQMTCTSASPYGITASEVSAGHVVNVANAIGRPPGGGSTRSPDSTVTVPTGGAVSAVLPPTGAPAYTGLLASVAMLLLGLGGYLAWPRRRRTT